VSQPRTRSERKHAAIVAAATSVFLDRGYHGASMDELARVAAVSKQTVYKHFASKKTLFEQVMLATSEPMHAALRLTECRPTTTGVLITRYLAT